LIQFWLFSFHVRRMSATRHNDLADGSLIADECHQVFQPGIGRTRVSGGQGGMRAVT